MGALQAITRPVGHFFVRVGTWLLAGDRESGEQLLSLVDEAAELDTIEDDERAIIRSVFELGETVVRELMVPRTDMATVDATATIDEAVATFLLRRVSRMPVIGEDADEVVGILHLRDTVGADPAQNVMSRANRPVFVPESQMADDLLRQMQRDRFHLAMVVDEYGGIAGLVTMEDLIEELVGEISDESDRAGDDVEDLGDGRYRILARHNIEDLGELFGIELADDDVDSAGGLLAKALGELPRHGASVVIAGLRLTVDRIERRRVKTLIAERAESLVAAEDAFPPLRRSLSERSESKGRR
ncbi:MAG TPA: hemolysin family protein [Microbacteriaceae bacterium]|nr:hemolysin family protein [Microbacteriaceae bacterium]